MVTKSKKNVVHHKLRTAIMSPSLEYCRMSASTPICVRMVLVELLGFTKQGTFSVKTGIVSGFRLAMGLLCWLQFSWMMYTPHPVSMAVMYLHLWHLSFDGKILSGSKSPKTILIYTGYFSLLQICFPPIKAIKVVFFQFATDVTTATAHLSCFFNFLPLHFNIYIPVLSSYISISLSASAGCKPGCCCKLLIVHTRHFLGHISHASLQPFSIKIPKLWRCKL